VEAVRRCDNVQTAGGHPIAAERGAETDYVFGAADLLELNRTLDGDTPPRIIYHSHPNGQAYFSPTDQQVARDPWGEGPAYPVQQLVVGLDGERVVEAVLFDWSGEEGQFVAIDSFPGKVI
jgi:proteasome lid subunit RPN8/RPN11